jgi:hypothetical protein
MYGMTGTKVLGRVKRDLLEMMVVGCDGPECLDDPFGVGLFALKCYIFELYYFREVDRSRPRPV